MFGERINRTRVSPGFLSPSQSKFVTFVGKRKCNRRILYLTCTRHRYEYNCGSVLTRLMLRLRIFTKRSGKMRKGSLKLHVRSKKRLQTYLQKLVALKAEVRDEAKVPDEYESVRCLTSEAKIYTAENRPTIFLNSYVTSIKLSRQYKYSKIT